jgi:hypothetical protein
MIAELHKFSLTLSLGLVVRSRLAFARRSKDAGAALAPGLEAKWQGTFVRGCNTSHRSISKK